MRALAVAAVLLASGCAFDSPPVRKAAAREGWSAGGIESSDPPPIVIRGTPRADVRAIGSAVRSPDADHRDVLARERRAHATLASMPWHFERTAHFLVFRERGADATEPLSALEDARSAALERLGLAECCVPRSALIPIFVFESRRAFDRIAQVDRWAAGCVEETPGRKYQGIIFLKLHEDGTYASTVQHEIAHIFVGEAFKSLDLPRWASEGVACYAENEEMRAAYVHCLGPTPDVPAGWFREDPDIHLKTDEAYLFYGRACFAFESLVREKGSVFAALRAARAISGP